MQDQTETILGAYLDRDFRVMPMGEGQATRSEVEAIGTRFGVKYPDEFITHVCGRFPGIYVEVKEEVWPRPKQYEVGPFWSMLYALHTFSPLAMSAQGRIFRWRHETNELEVEAAGFWDILAFEVSALRERKERKKRG